ncbi:MAG: hypothetical protein AAF990_01965 [Bacteroidota bacterium]
MNFFVAFGKGFVQMFRSIGMWLLFYALNFLLALFAIIPLDNLIASKLGRSLALGDLLEGYDYTTYSDFRNLPGVRDALPAILNQSLLTLLLFFLLAIFLTGGILKVLRDHKERFRFQHFWTGCSTYFWRLFRLTLYFLLVHAMILSLAIGLFLFLTEGGNILSLDSELEYLNALKIAGPAYLFLASIFFMIHDYAKVHMVHLDDNWMLRPFWQSFGIALSNFFRTYPLYLLNALVFVGLFSAYWYLQQYIQPSDARGVALAFALGQGFILARIGSKIWNLASITFMYQGIQQRRQRKKEIVQPNEPTDMSPLIISDVGSEETAPFLKKEEE